MQTANARQLVQRVSQRLIQSPLTDRSNMAVIALGLLILLMGSYAMLG